MGRSILIYSLFNTATSYRSPPATVWSQLYEQSPPARRLYRRRRPPPRCRRLLARATAAFRQPRSQDLVGFPLPCPAVPLTGSRVLPTLCEHGHARQTAGTVTAALAVTHSTRTHPAPPSTCTSRAGTRDRVPCVTAR